jgi:imidazolonepropionase-like amidohydrolase
MRVIWTAAFLGLILTATARGDTTAFVNVNLIPMTSEKVLRSQTVIVVDSLISAIGSVDDTPVPDGAVVIDGTDRYLLPGLAEMHGHVPGANSANLDRVLNLYIANGVTTVRGMLGQPSHLVLRRSLEHGEILGPRLITSGPSFNGRSVSSPEAAIDMVRTQHAEGYDFLKIHPGLSRDEFDAVAATANELGIPFAGHVPEDVGVPRGIATIDHLDGYMQTLLPANEDPSGGLGGFFGVFIADQAQSDRIPSISSATLAAGTWNVPTESLFEHVTSPSFDTSKLADRPEMKYMTASTVREWQEYREALLSDPNYTSETAARAIEMRQELIRELHSAGAGLLLGSDSPQIFNVPGFALHHELQMLVDAGLSPFEALRTGTANPAAFLADESFGTIVKGKVADLMLLDASPLEAIANSRRIHGVMVRGQWLSRSDLDDMLQPFERQAHSLAP